MGATCRPDPALRRMARGLHPETNDVRISLLHNPDAGDGVSFSEVERALEGAGYEIAREVDKRSNLGRLLEVPVDFVVAAGGDGTVRRAALALAGSGVPLAILPLGTANNIAGSLGAAGTVDEAIARWRSPRLVPFDLGVVRGPSGVERFLEGVGSGLVPAAIAAAKAHPARGNGDASEALRRDLETYAETLSTLPPEAWTGRIDDVFVQGELLLLEVLNIPSIGPNLVLAEEASPSDGAFDVVMAGAPERETLAAYLEARRRGDERVLRLPSRRARRVEVGDWTRVHLDADVLDLDPSGKITIEIDAAALTILV